MRPRTDTQTDTHTRDHNTFRAIMSYSLYVKSALTVWTLGVA